MKTPRKLDPKHLKAVASLPCCVCQRRETVVAHHKTGAGMGMKADDDQTMPLCERHHTGAEGIHQIGRKEWEARYGSQDDHIADTLRRVRSDITI